MSVWRKIVNIGDLIRNQAILQQGSPEEMLGRAERMLIELGLESSSSEEFRTPMEVITAAGGLQSYLDRRKQSGIPTGFDRIDRMTCGMQPGQLWIVGAITSGGKSSLIRNIALNAGRRGYPGAFITLEMSEGRSDRRVDLCGGRNRLTGDSAGVEHRQGQILAAATEVCRLQIHIRDRAGCTIPQLHALLRKLKAEYGITYAMVDYLQQMTPVGRFDNRTNEVSHLSRGLKNIAVDLKIPVIAPSQLKRVGEKPRRPLLSDLRESGSIEQDANVVILLYSESLDMDLQVYPTEVIVAKQRCGPIGTILFEFNKAQGIFRETVGGPQGVLA